MYLMFLLAINIGGALQPLFDVGSVALFVHGIQWIGYTLHFPDWLTIFLAQGLGGGINTVLPLVPQIGMTSCPSPSLRTPGIWRVRRL